MLLNTGFTGRSHFKPQQAPELQWLILLAVRGIAFVDGSTTLQSIANGGIINWYNSPTGSSIGNWSTFVTPIINTTTTFFMR
jgi:hypothetical protein